MTVDVHSHFFPQLSRGHSKFLDPDDTPWLDLREDGKGMIKCGGRDFRPVYDACWSADRRIEEMDRHDVDIQIMCATPVLFAYSKPANKTRDWAMLVNDMGLELCSTHGARLKCMAQVPLQDPALACQEVSRARASGHVGVQIGNHVGDRNMDDPGFIEFLQHCAAEGMPVLVHPWDMLGRERMPRYMLPWLVAMPAETQLSILSLILSGGFEKLPRSLKLCFAHGGGSFAFLLGRADNAWRQRDIVREDCPQPPSSYVDRFYVDSAVFDQRALKLLVDVMGSERVMFGTDYPFPLGEEDMASLVRTAPEFGNDCKARILGLNAQEFFSLDTDHN
ncbi:MAG: amidohydrolase family protein [Gammaproteobacteria bacterium]|nr:amidohydrolase family protein [Gammaproteobacteria bacterium]